MRTGLRAEEEWARGVIAASLGLEVVQHDDGSADGMHDLDVYDGPARVAAVEVTAAADGQVIALWKLVNPPGDRWIESALAGGRGGACTEAQEAATARIHCRRAGGRSESCFCGTRSRKQRSAGRGQCPGGVTRGDHRP